MKKKYEAKINRRRFCMIGAAALASFSMPSVAASVQLPRLSGRCLLRVVRRCSFQDLQSCWSDDPDVGACEAFSDGQEIEITPEIYAGFERGEGFCPHAWRAVRPYVDAIMRGEASVSCSPLREGSDTAALVCCPEGTRPVVFALFSDGKVCK